MSRSNNRVPTSIVVLAAVVVIVQVLAAPAAPPERTGTVTLDVDEPESVGVDETNTDPVGSKSASEIVDGLSPIGTAAADHPTILDETESFRACVSKNFDFGAGLIGHQIRQQIVDDALERCGEKLNGDTVNESKLDSASANTTLAWGAYANATGRMMSREAERAAQLARDECFNAGINEIANGWLNDTSKSTVESDAKTAMKDCISKEQARLAPQISAYAENARNIVRASQNNSDVATFMGNEGSKSYPPGAGSSNYISVDTDKYPLVNGSTVDVKSVQNTTGETNNHVYVGEAGGSPSDNEVIWEQDRWAIKCTDYSNCATGYETTEIWNISGKHYTGAWYAYKYTYHQISNDWSSQVLDPTWTALKDGDVNASELKACSDSFGQTGTDYGSPEGRAWATCVGGFGGGSTNDTRDLNPEPETVDSDGDGTPNSEDSDIDGDGLSNEKSLDDDGDGLLDSCDASFQSDSNRYVVEFDDGTSANDAKGVISDVGGTFIADYETIDVSPRPQLMSAELTDSQKSDLESRSTVRDVRKKASDGDTLTNSEAECKADPDPKVPEDVGPADVDTDGDGTPNDEDTDIDGDGTNNGNDPDDDGDGIPDSEDPDPKIPNEVSRSAYYEITVETPSGTVGPKAGLVMGECVGDDSTGPFYGTVDEYSNYTAQDCQLWASFNGDAKLIQNGSTIRVGAVFKGGNQTDSLSLEEPFQTIRPANVDNALDRSAERAAAVDSILGSVIPTNPFDGLFEGGGGGLSGGIPGPGEAPALWGGGVVLALLLFGGRS